MPLRDRVEPRLDVDWDELVEEMDVFLDILEAVVRGYAPQPRERVFVHKLEMPRAEIADMKRFKKLVFRLQRMFNVLIEIDRDETDACFVAVIFRPTPKDCEVAMALEDLLLSSMQAYDTRVYAHAAE